MTIAKVQGLTLDSVVYNCYGISASDLYIIVSRVRNIRKLYPDQAIGAAHPDLLKPVPGLTAVYNKFREFMKT